MTDSKPFIVAATVAGIVAIGWIDFATGVEYRIFALYYLPLSLTAWHLGRSGAVSAAILCAVSWLMSNYLAGLRYSSSVVWVVNFLMQGLSFIVVGLLIATVRRAFLHAYDLSRIDALTSLLNSRAFSEEAARILALGRRHGHPVTIAYIDLDNFKAVNDTLGHNGGDDVLRATAGVLRQALRSGDLAARVGGDEFVVLLPETGSEGAGGLIERLRSALARSLTGVPPITASVGAVSFAEPPESVQEMIRAADSLMYEAKAAGKDQTRLSVVSAPSTTAAQASQGKRGAPPDASLAS